MRLRPLDLVALLGAALAVALSAMVAYTPSNSALRVVISGSGGQWIYPLASDRTVQVAGPLGLTTVVIGEKTVHVSDSPCRNKICIAMGSISSAGQWVACLPNRVFVRIEGETAEGAADTGAY